MRLVHSKGLRLGIQFHRDACKANIKGSVKQYTHSKSCSSILFSILTCLRVIALIWAISVVEIGPTLRIAMAYAYATSEFD